MVPTRRFGRTELAMPLLSLGGMRFQQSWTDLSADQISTESQCNLKQILQAAMAAGMHHIETARFYGSSEIQLGGLLAIHPDPRRILQTKIAPNADLRIFESSLQRSFELLQLKKIDLLTLHGINLPEHLDQSLRPGGCLEVLQRWQKDGFINHVGFSTHGPLDLIEAAINSGSFDYVNIHWYYIRQDNDSALTAAKDQDMGVFLISPTDKGGHLHSPSETLNKLCFPLHPIVFNDLFCLSDSRVHTISVGAAKAEDLALHIEAVKLLPNADQLLAPIKIRLQQALENKLGASWLNSWHKGLPAWQVTPGMINLPVLLWLHNLLEAWDLHSYAKARYGLLGQADHWFPGSNADGFEAPIGSDGAVSEAELLMALSESPWREQIPGILRSLKQKLGGAALQRLGV
jgi:predicted aldo/keto reductase-like oxidoreductase